MTDEFGGIVAGLALYMRRRNPSEFVNTLH